MTGKMSPLGGFRLFIKGATGAMKIIDPKENSNTVGKLAMRISKLK
jgi:hypothetical protein